MTSYGHLMVAVPKPVTTILRSPSRSSSQGTLVDSECDCKLSDPICPQKCSCSPKFIGSRESPKPLNSNSHSDAGIQNNGTANEQEDKQSNDLLVFIGPIAVFIASINAGLISIARDSFDSSPSPVVFVVGSTSEILQTEDNSTTQITKLIQTMDTGPTPAQQVIYICFYLAMVLSLFCSAFAWLMHGSTLKFLGIEVDNNNPAITSGSVFWLISFITPSLFLTCIGLGVFIWTTFNSTPAIGAIVSVGILYCFWQVYKAFKSLSEGMKGERGSRGTANDEHNPNAQGGMPESPIDLEKGLHGK